MKIELESLGFGYAPGQPALEGIDLQVEPGELLALLGPSGSGKTTLLLLLAGFLAPSAGAVRLGGKTASDRAVRILPREREIGMVFQDLALWPHMTVRGHLDFVLRSRKAPREERGRRAGEVLEMVGLSGAEGKLPSRLSGGEGQRLALARALVGRPRILLLDEPLGALDRALREKTLELIAHLHRELGTTTVYVTHDYDEALAVAGRAAVLDRGRLQAVGSPQDLYRRPATAVVARLSGPVTLLEGKCLGRERVELPFGTFPAAFGAAAGSNVTVSIRPEQARVAAVDAGDTVSVATGVAMGIARGSSFRAGGWDVVVDLSGASVKGRSAAALPPGQRASVTIREPLWGFKTS